MKIFREHIRRTF